MIIDKDKILDLYDIETSCLQIAESLSAYSGMNEHKKELVRIADIASSLGSHMRCSFRLSKLKLTEEKNDTT
tara:strand:+ start:59 stop:274 length:216 start_codon:yes stop_codon:yes gene_type:complete